jgi:uncharacterized membrane protein YeaQ/YmgE (transglycosylase-associated protein family)
VAWRLTGTITVASDQHSKCPLSTQNKENSTMLTIITAVIVGALMGALVYGFDYLIHGQNMAILLTNFIFGALGSYSGTYLVNYGPHVLGVDILPTLAGGIVLSFVMTYAIRRFILHKEVA